MQIFSIFVLVLISTIENVLSSAYIFLQPMKCYPQDFIPLLNMKWNDEASVEINQILESGHQTKYFLQSRGANLINLLSGVASIQNKETSFRFSFHGTFLNQTLELYLNQTEENIQVFFRNVNSGKKIYMELIRNVPPSKTKDTYSFSWTIKYLDQETQITAGTFFSNCSLIFDRNSDCNFRLVLSFPLFERKWIIDGEIQRSENGRTILSARITKSGSVIDSLLIKANWIGSPHELFFISIEIFSENESFFSLRVNSETLPSSNWELSFEMFSVLFDWRLCSNWTIQPRQDGRKVFSVSEANYYVEPTTRPIKYLFGLTQSNSSSRVFDLRHNISSTLYRFEGNMTVELEPLGSEQAIVTEITQKVETSLKRALYQDLRQIFHQSGHWNWETVLMKSGLFDMHVSGHWNHTIFDFYRKRFQFRSHDENFLPSLNLAIDYSNRLSFYHVFSFPFLARTYSLLVDFSNPSSLLPAQIKILFRDEFKTNYSQNIAQLNFLRENGVLNMHVSANWLDVIFIMEGITSHIGKLSNWVSDNQHPFNELLQPIFRRPTVAYTYLDVLKWLKQLLYS